MMKTWVLVCTVLLALATQAKVKKMPLEIVEEIEKHEILIESINQIELIANQDSREFKINCLKVTGDLPVCECLTSNRKIGMSYSQYSYLVSSPREVLNAEFTHKDDRAFWLAALKARKVCVK